MVTITLRDNERAVLEQLVTQEALTPAARRAQALLWLDQGESMQAVACALRVSRQTVYNWVTNFYERRANHDIKARLTDRKRSGRPRSSLTQISQSAGPQTLDLLLAQVLSRDPREFGYRSVVWTPRLLKQYLREVHQIRTATLLITEALARLETWWTPAPSSDREESSELTASEIPQ